MKMGQGYAIALQHYTQQKEDFLNYLEYMTKETQQSLKSRVEDEVVVAEVTEAQVDAIIARINYLIENSSLKQTKQEISQIYEQTGRNKELAAQQTEAALGGMLSPSWIRQHILSQLPNSLGNNINRINSSALFGKIKQLFNMAMRHTGTLDPSAWTKSNISGILYEHAVTDGLRQFFNRLSSEFTDKISVSGVGAQGGRGDIKISINDSEYFTSIIGTSGLDLAMQIKQVDLDRILSSENHTDKINVGSATALLDEFLKTGQPHDMINTMYFLSKGQNVIRAIGRDVALYGFEHGKIKFTADLINTLHYEKSFALAFDKIRSADRKQQAYIRWVKQRR